MRCNSIWESLLKNYEFWSKWHRTILLYHVHIKNQWMTSAFHPDISTTNLYEMTKYLTMTSHSLEIHSKFTCHFYVVYAYFNPIKTGDLQKFTKISRCLTNQHAHNKCYTIKFERQLVIKSHKNIKLAFSPKTQLILQTPIEWSNIALYVLNTDVHSGKPNVWTYEISSTDSAPHARNRKPFQCINRILGM